jgi:hypothetical protein
LQGPLHRESSMHYMHYVLFYRVLAACALDRRIRFTDCYRIREHLRSVICPRRYHRWGTQDKKCCRTPTKCRSFHNSVLTADGQSVCTHLTELSPRVADLSGPRTNILLRGTSNLARRSDADCLIRPSLKFCQRRAGFSGSLLDKTSTRGADMGRRAADTLWLSES